MSEKRQRGKHTRSQNPRPPGRCGFTLLEIVIVTGLLLIGFLAVTKSILSSLQLNGTNRESALATDGIREMIEVLSGVEDFSTVLALYDGAGFDVDGLEPVEDDPDGRVGEILFPVVDVGAERQLREDGVPPDFPFQRDLDGDGEIDAENHSGDYVLLPVLVRLTWKGNDGERSMEVRTLLADR